MKELSAIGYQLSVFTVVVPAKAGTQQFDPSSRTGQVQQFAAQFGKQITDN